ncbi:hypothetical protein ENBRE01_2026 [Enteropsectra breve]|nr:hypothetical protein ENBRE01_2026 [Enteropsectra breve]
MENFYVNIEETVHMINTYGIVDRDVHINGRTLEADRPLSKVAEALRDNQFEGQYFIKRLEFDPKLIRSNEHEILLISDENVFYRLNRYTEDVEDLGQIKDPIRDVLLTDEGVYILTTQELMHFNSSCELIHSAKVETVIEDMKEGDLIGFYKDNKKYDKKLKFKIIALEDNIAIVHKHIYIFNRKLGFVNKLPQEIQGATFIKKYNMFACIKGDQVVFIEPNGIEHGDPLLTPNFYSKKIDQMHFGDESFLVLADGNSTRVYYMKNSYWFKKLEIPGKFHSVYDETICLYDYRCSGITFGTTDDANANLTRKDKNNIKNWYSVSRLFFNRGIDPFWLIDGNTLKCTNLYQTQQPPPCYFKEIETENNIKSVFYNDGLLFIYVDNTIDSSTSENLKCKKKNVILKSRIKCGDKQASVDDSHSQEYRDNALYIYETINDNIRLYKKCEIRNCNILCEEIIYGNRDFIILRSDDKIQKIYLDDRSSDKRAFKTKIPKDSPILINASVIKGDIAMLYTHGFFCYRNRFYNVIDIYEPLCKIEGKFSVKYIEESNMIKIFILANNALVEIDVEDGDGSFEIPADDIGAYKVKPEDVSRVIAVDVVSFICYKNYVIYNIENTVFIYGGNTVISELSSEENSTLLMVNNNEIVMQNKSGSLESITVNEFST